MRRKLDLYEWFKQEFNSWESFFSLIIYGPKESENTLTCYHHNIE